MSFVALYIRFIGGITLILNICVVYVLSICTPTVGFSENVSNINITDNNQCMEKECYNIRPRLFIWFRQIFLFIFLCTYVFVFVLNHRDGLDTSEQRVVLQYSSHVIYIIAVILLLLCDNLNNLGNLRMMQMWLSAYIIIFIISFGDCFLNDTTSASLVLLVLSFVVCGFAVFCAFIDISYPQVNPPTPEYTCGLLTALSFSHINDILIIPGMKKASFEFADDIPRFSDADSVHQGWVCFRAILLSNKKLNLWYSLLQLIKWEWVAQGCFQFLGVAATYITPLALERILIHIANNSQDDDTIESIIPISVELAVVMLFVGPMLSSIGDGQNYVRGRHIGVRVKGVLIAAIYNKALSVDLSASKESVGKLNNLISVDVSDIQEFCCYSHMMWSTLLEILLCSGLLYVVLGHAAFGGLAVMIVSLVVGLAVSKLVERFQAQLLKCKDARIGLVNEVLNSMRVIKYYAWERKFRHRINATRKAEVKQLRAYAVTNAVLYTFWEVVPAVVGATAFVLHTYVLGNPLTPATGFTALTLFNLLRFPLDVFPEMLNALVRTKVSIGRIETFLCTPNVRGITNACAHDELSPVHHLAENLVERFVGHEFAPKAFANLHRIIDNPFAHSDRDMAGAVVLRGLRLAWSPTLREDSEESTVRAKSSENLCLCMRSINLASGIRDFIGVFHEITGRDARTKGSSKYKLLDPVNSEVATTNIIDVVAEPSGLEVLSNDTYLPEMKRWRVTGYRSRSSSMESDASVASAQDQCNLSPMVILDKTSLTIPRGALAVVVGATGSGKSSLLQGALLGEALLVAGSVVVGGRISYASQSAWIQNATLRENVLFGSPYDKERYERVVFSCALLSDFKLFPAGDMTEIGEKGVNLSGGQQQRVSLARAAYAHSDVILLDDPLSAVDALVGEHIFKELIVGFLSDRTRILVTHNISMTVNAADIVICLEHNDHNSSAARSCVLACCPPRDLPRVIQSVRARSRKNSSEAGDDDDLGVFLDGLLSAVETGYSKQREFIPNSNNIGEVVNANQDSEEKADTVIQSALQQDSEYSETDDDAYFLQTQRLHMRQNNSYATLCKGVNTVPLLSSTSEANAIASNASKQQVTIVDKEGKSIGNVGWEVYWFYFKACGGAWAVVGIVGATMLCTLAWLFQNVSLGEWMYEMEHGGRVSSRAAFQVYVLGVLLVLLTTMLRACSQVTSNLTSANRLHERLINSVLNAPCSWFDATPIGRIVNRFSQDISTVDSSIVMHMYGFMDRLINTLQIVAVVCVSIPLLIVPLLPVVVFTWWVSKQYLHVSRELKRLESLKKSPVFVLFSETLQGLPIVRAFRAEGRFFKDCCDRVDEMNRCHLYLWISNRWLAFRMQMLGAVVAGLVGLAVVLEAGRIGSTMAGIVLIYSLSFCEALTFLARAHADCQMDLNSIERLQEYSDLPAEKGLDEGDTDDVGACEERGSVENSRSVELTNLLKPQLYRRDSLPTLDSSQHPLMAPQLPDMSHNTSLNHFWPREGRVEFRNIFLKYSSCATPVLRNVSFTIPGKTKLGVVGRTGAGKSSLVAALFRLVEPASGELFIDGVDVLNLPLHELRNKIAIVPQEPTLLRGSVRSNLDPFEQHTDEELWTALTSAHLAEHVRNMPSDPAFTGSPRISSSKQIASLRGSLSDKLVSEKGANFSLGQRQLLCMARAILRKASVLVLDECTASVDHETDALIQETVRKELSDCTVICIAHRLHTIAYYDNVLVMDQGRVVECAEPLELINSEHSIFRQMCLTSGDFEELLDSAQVAHEERKAAFAATAAATEII